MRAARSVLLWAVVAGCSIEVPAQSVGQICRTNGDCATGEACTWDRCHALCLVSGDCVPTVCASLRGGPVCLLADEQPCSIDVACLDGLGCGADEACHAACEASRDCTAEQTCTDGLCLEPVPEDAVPDAGEDATEELEETPDAEATDDAEPEAAEGDASAE